MQLALDELCRTAPVPDRLPDPAHRLTNGTWASVKRRQAGMIRAGLAPSVTMSTNSTWPASSASASRSTSMRSGTTATITGCSAATPSRMNGTVPARNSSSPARGTPRGGSRHGSVAREASGTSMPRRRGSQRRGGQPGRGTWCPSLRALGCRTRTKACETVSTHHDTPLAGQRASVSVPGSALAAPDHGAPLAPWSGAARGAGCGRGTAPHLIRLRPLQGQEQDSGGWAAPILSRSPRRLRPVLRLVPWDAPGGKVVTMGDVPEGTA